MGMENSDLPLSSPFLGELQSQCFGFYCAMYFIVIKLIPRECQTYCFISYIYFICSPKTNNVFSINFLINDRALCVHGCSQRRMPLFIWIASFCDVISVLHSRCNLHVGSLVFQPQQAVVPPLVFLFNLQKILKLIWRTANVGALEQ